MVVWSLIVMTTLLQMSSMIRADSVHGPGYVGCYPAFGAVNDWQRELTIDDTLTTVDECADRCAGMSKAFAVIALRSCYCSDGLPRSISKATDSSCNVRCYSNPCQICGSCRYYSVYNTTERLQSSCSLGLSWHVVDGQTTVNCSQHCTQDGTTYRPNVQTTIPPNANVYTTFTTENDQGKKKDFCRCQAVWLRIVIDVAVILGVSSLVFFISCGYTRCCSFRSGSGIQSMSAVQNSITTSASNLGVAYQSLNFQTSRVDIKNPRDNDPPRDSSIEKPDSVRDTAISSNFEDHTYYLAPSTSEGCAQQPEGAIGRQEIIDVDADGCIPMDWMRRVSPNMACNTVGNLMFGNDSSLDSSVDKPDSARDTATSSNFKDNTINLPAPSKLEGCVQQPEGATGRQETTDVDTDMDRMSRVSQIVECNPVGKPVVGNEERKRITESQGVNYENSDVWRKRNRIISR